MNPEAESFKIEVGQLTQTSFASEQERAEAIAAQLKVTPIDGNLPSKGEKGDPGDTWERVTEYLTVTADSKVVTGPDSLDLEGAGVTLVSNGEPTIHIMAVKKNVVYLSDAPTSGNLYKIAYSIWKKK